MFVEWNKIKNLWKYECAKMNSAGTFGDAMNYTFNEQCQDVQCFLDLLMALIP